MSIDWDRVERVLVIRLDNIGDVVMLTPALRAIRLRLPHAHVTLLASPAGALVAPLLPWVDAVMVHRATWQDASGSMPLDPEREQAFVSELRGGGFDVAFVFTSFSQSPWPPAYACYLAGIPLRVGQSREFGGSVLSHRVLPPDDGVHQVDRSLHMLQAVGVAPAGIHLELAIPTIHRERALSVLERAGLGQGRRYAVVAPGASCPSRRYDPARFSRVAAGLGDEGLDVVVVGSDKEQDLAAKVATGANAVSVAGATSVPELAAVVAGAALVITNNSAPMHVADAFGRPTVLLFAGTELEDQWRPRSCEARLLRRPTWCAPCRAFECSYELECLDLPAREVLSTARELMAIDAHPTGTQANHGEGRWPVRSAS